MRYFCGGSPTPARSFTQRKQPFATKQWPCTRTRENLGAMPLRSYLFVPADRPERFTKALQAGAHAVIIDLEDAVAPGAKAAARAGLDDWLRGAPERSVHLRINAMQTPWFEDDLALCVMPAVQGVILPKTESTDQVAVLAGVAPGTPVLPLIETAAGLEACRAIARAPGVQRLVFGSLDFQADLGIEGDDDALLAFRSELVLASRLGQLQAPVDGVTTALDDHQVLAADTARARRLGFGAKLCIHPRQVQAVNDGFAPSPQELAWARRVMEAMQSQPQGAITVDGKMVDAPVLKRARALLEAA
jgi:citrate lyase subunit beta/citryl-CoA lyase